MARGVLLTTALCASLISIAGGTEAVFAPWTVMGPVNTQGRGQVTVELSGSALEYNVTLYNVTGLRSVEMHVGDPASHGDVAAVLCASAFPSSTSVANGPTCAGSLDSDGLLGPFLLPEGYHLDVSVLYDRYIMAGQATVVVHTLANPAGELGAVFPMMMAPGMAPDSMAHMGSHTAMPASSG